MKKHFLIILLFSIFSVGISRAQHIDWHGGYLPFEYTGYGTVTEDSTSFIFNSEYYDLKLWLDEDGHTLNFIATAKNIPHVDNQDYAEFNITIVDDTNYTSSEVLFDQGEIWNETGDYPYYTGYIYKVYPTEDEYTYSGSVDLGNSEKPLIIYGGATFFNTDGNTGSGLQIVPRFYPN